MPSVGKHISTGNTLRLPIPLGRARRWVPLWWAWRTLRATPWSALFYKSRIGACSCFFSYRFAMHFATRNCILSLFAVYTVNWAVVVSLSLQFLLQSTSPHFRSHHCHIWHNFLSP